MKKSLQYRRVDKAIINAFIQIAGKISFEKITVQNILDEALVSRYTFYKHFHDKYEIAERLQDELYQEYLIFMQTRIPELDSMAMPAREHHQLFDLETAKFTKKNHTKLQAIKNIHTETIDFYRLIKNYSSEHYLECHPNARLEARIYANMVEAVIDYYIDYDQNPNENVSETVMKAHIRACLYGIGIHDETKMQKIQDYLSVLVYQR